jgi:hypothetical protein
MYNIASDKDNVNPKHAYLDGFYKKIVEVSKEINGFTATLVYGSGAIGYEGKACIAYLSPAWYDYQDSTKDFDESKSTIAFDIDDGEDYKNQPDIPFPLTMDLEKDLEAYFKIVTPLLEAIPNPQ